MKKVYRIYRATPQKMFIDSSVSKVHGKSWHDLVKDSYPLRQMKPIRIVNTEANRGIYMETIL